VSKASPAGNTGWVNDIPFAVSEIFSGPNTAIMAFTDLTSSKNVWVQDAYGYAQWGGPGNDFAVSDDLELYGLTQSRGSVEWADNGSWTQIGGSAGRLFGGGSGASFFATGCANNSGTCVTY
jgi:hypothetical protein